MRCGACKKEARFQDLGICTAVANNLYHHHKRCCKEKEVWRRIKMVNLRAINLSEYSKNYGTWYGRDGG